MVDMILSRLIFPIIAVGFVFLSFSTDGRPTITKRSENRKEGLSFQALAGASVPPSSIGINVSGLASYEESPAFQNLAFGDDWKTGKWVVIPAGQQTADGGVRYTVAGQGLNRFLTIPSTLPAGGAIRCTYQGSGTLGVAGLANLLSSSPGTIVFSTKAAATGGGNGFWLTLNNVAQASPFENLNCRQITSTAPALMRPEYVRFIAGYPVVRFMNWQNSNANIAVTWATRHQQGDSRYGNDGVSIEDMMAFANQVNAAPWFVMPWNADDAYIAGFAKYVAQTLPANQSVYVEVGNEVWNVGFAVARQAQQEGLQLKLASSPTEAGLLRYAQKTIHDMQIWEAAFSGRSGLVRVVSSQHVVPQRAQIILSAPGLVDHVDALATAPYFGTLMGGVVSRAAIINSLAAALPQTENYGLQEKAVAQSFGKRYIAYEGGQSLAVPANIPLLHEVETSPEMYSFYISYLEWWKNNIGDTLCLFTSNGLPAGGGDWGITEFENDTPAQSAKLRAVLQER